MSLPRYAYLGPSGTFTEQALAQVVGRDEAQYLPQPDVTSALAAVRAGRAEYAVVAIESTGQGGVTATLDALATGEPLVLLREMLVPVQFDVVAAPGVGLADVRRVSAHPHAWAQSRTWLTANLPGAVHVPAASNTSSAALLGAGEQVPFDAALVPPSAVEAYGLELLSPSVADNPDAVTRFVLVGHPGEVPPPTGADKTTLVVHLPDDEAGALLSMLEQFATRGINLSRIESRPIGDALGRYSFSIDAEGHVADERVGEALMGLRRHCPFVRFLGSYARADEVEPVLRAGTADADYADARAWLDGLRRGEVG
ncbi:MAG: prephenate dehydratase [Actinobacteria bacterium]|nr:prephenate dehydratase [Actinomycetota bacterium]MCG2801811.1 prephenate dehydratase [Cellulomonas sp.]